MCKAGGFVGETLHDGSSSVADTSGVSGAFGTPDTRPKFSFSFQLCYCAHGQQRPF